VFGVDFNSVMSRGSQFKVESFMFRIAKPESFVLVSPSREAVSRERQLPPRNQLISVRLHRLESKMLPKPNH
jgi:DNA polymerase elongation subunit (family B)